MAIIAAAVLPAQRKKKERPAVGDAVIVATSGGQTFDTPSEECRSLVADSQGRIWTIGVQSDGPEELNRTRQFIQLGRVDASGWTARERVTASGYVYFPVVTPDDKGGLWLAWSMFDQQDRTWQVHAAYFDGKLQPAARLSRGHGPALRPAIVVEADGNPLVVFESAEKNRFALHAAKLSGGGWREETLPSTDSNFRPALAKDRQGTTWLAWDRFTGGDYDVLVRSRKSGAWSAEIPFFAGAEDEQRPSLRVASDDTVWVLAGKRLAGIHGGTRVELEKPAGGAFDEILFDAAGRLWLFAADKKQLTRIALLDGKTTATQFLETPLGYRAPLFDRAGNLWDGGLTAIHRSRIALTSSGPARLALRTSSRLDETKQAEAAPAHAPHETIRIDGETYTLYFGEMHTHLTEHPTDRHIEIWPDRFYLKAARSGVLDLASYSDHDWKAMTSSKYMAEQGYTSVLSRENEFLAFSGYEWSGDNKTRLRYGDRTIVFPRDYSPVFRITDPESDTPQKLHVKLQSIGAIDWAHHVGAPFAVMDWTTHDKVIEPIIETVSGHGVYETYDRPNAVPVWLKKEPVGKTSIQDGLGMGKRFGLVGSSDSHNGLSGYANGMLGIYAKSLTREAILDAFRNRRTFAIRGGEPLYLDFRINGSFMGREIRSDGPPRLSVHVRAHSPIQKVEVVRDGKYVFTKDGSGPSCEFEYKDTAKGNYYYVRVWLEGDKYAWSTPAWVD